MIVVVYYDSDSLRRFSLDRLNETSDFWKVDVYLGFYSRIVHSKFNQKLWETIAVLGHFFNSLVL